MVAFTKPQQLKKEESERLRGEGDKIKFIDFRFERWQVVGFGKEGRMQGATFLPSTLIAIKFYNHKIKLIAIKFYNHKTKLATIKFYYHKTKLATIKFYYHNKVDNLKNV